MSRKTKLLAVALTAIMVLSVFAYAPAAASADASTAGNTLVVDDDFGTDHNDDNDTDLEYETIQGAVDDADAGDRIEVRAGTYNENVKVDVGNLVMQGAGTSDVTVVGNNSSGPTMRLGADDIQFSGFTVQAPPGGAPSLAVADLINDSHVKGVVVEDNVIAGNGDTDVLAGAGPPIGTDQARNLVFRNNQFTGGTVEDPMEWGFWLSARDSTMEGNTWDVKVSDGAVGVWGPSNTLTDNTINYPGIADFGLYIAPGGTNTHVDGLDVDGHPDEHLHQEEERGDWVVYGVYVAGSESTLENVDSHESHVGIYVGGEENGNYGVRNVTILDSVADDNLNHDLEIDSIAFDTHVENFQANSGVVPDGSQADKYKDVYPTYGANVWVYGGSGHSLVDVTSTNEFPIGIAMDDVDDSLVDNAEIRNKGVGEANLERFYPLTTGISLEGSSDNTITNSLVRDNDVGISVVEGSGNQIVGNNPGIYNNTDVGISLNDAPNTLLADNDVRENGIGLDVTSSDPVRAKYSNFVENGEGIVASDSSDVDARWNWFGATNGPSGSATDGALSGSGDSIEADSSSTITYDPFLTAPKDEVEQDPDKTKQFAHDLVTNGSQGVQTFATPGPANVSIQVSQQDAMVWTYDDGSFTVLNSPSVQAETLRAWGISNLAHGENARVVIDFDDTGPSTPGSEGLEDGWNFVASPQYGDADDVVQTTTNRKRIAQGYDQFDSQPFTISPPVTQTPFAYPFDTGTNEPRLSAYAGYWVYVDGSGELIAAVPSGVTVSEEGGLIKA